MMCLDAGGRHKLFSCILGIVTILIDCTGRLFRPLMTPGLCGGEQELSILCERMQVVASSLLCVYMVNNITCLPQDGCQSHFDC